MFIFIGFVTWHCKVITLHPSWPFAHAHYRNRIEFGRRHSPEKDWQRLKLYHWCLSKTLLLYRFWASGRPTIYMCVWGYFFTLPFFLHLNLSITWSLQNARMTKSPVFLNKETHSPEREVQKKYLYFVKPIHFWASLIFNHTKNNV